MLKIEDITCPRVDTNFIYDYSTRYLTSERSEVHTNISDHFRNFPKMSEDVRRLPKVAECFRAIVEDVSIT